MDDVMAGEKKPKNLRRRLIGIAGSLLSLAILTYIAVIVITGSQPGFLRVFGLFPDGDAAEMANEYHFDVGRSRVFADLNGSIAAAGTLGIQVNNAGGDETLRDSFRMSTPVINENNGRAIAYDVGGTEARVFNESSIIASIETGGAIVSASINRNGWFSICTQESGAVKGIITAYNDSGRSVYRVNMSSGYVLSAALSQDNKNIAILNYTDSGSRISFYKLSNENIDRAIDLPDGIILDIRYLSNGDVLALTTTSLLIAGKNGEFMELYDFAGKRLGGYLIDGNTKVLYLLDYSVGNRGRLITLGEDGKLLGELETDKGIISMSFSGGFLAVLMNDGLSVCSASLEELHAPEGFASAAGAKAVLVLDGGRVLAAGDHSAVIIRFKEG
ncbi:MAG: DUF5711 family protein [Oscillospiraceae bacterium]|nr:DUF5711 family protein [Oscillospiraceae bacterium]